MISVVVWRRNGFRNTQLESTLEVNYFTACPFVSFFGLWKFCRFDKKQSYCQCEYSTVGQKKVYRTFCKKHAVDSRVNKPLRLFICVAVLHFYSQRVHCKFKNYIATANKQPRHGYALRVRVYIAQNIISRCCRPGSQPIFLHTVLISKCTWSIG